MRLSILICTIPGRDQYLARLRSVLDPQIDANTEIIIDDSVNTKIGLKRNSLLLMASGDFVSFVDDDDLVSSHYVQYITNTIRDNPGIDCVGISGIILFQYTFPRKFIHSIQCGSWHEANAVYYRTPNHLNPIRRSLAIQVMFNQYKSHGEDIEFSTRMRPLLKKEKYIDTPLYYYFYDKYPLTVLEERGTR